MQYVYAHHLHVACVALSVSLFVLRGGLMMAGSPLLQTRLLRTVPHVVDTVLLASALWLVSVLHLPVFQTPWLVAKLIGLVAYVVLGSLALRRARSRPVRIAAFVAALATVGWMISVAVRHDPWGFLALL